VERVECSGSGRSRSFSAEQVTQVGAPQLDACFSDGVTESRARIRPDPRKKILLLATSSFVSQRPDVSGRHAADAIRSAIQHLQIVAAAPDDRVSGT
jgi:hypothetical protein